MSCIPTFVNVPPPTTAKSQDTGPELLLIELLGGVPVCAETGGTPRSKSITTPTENRMTRAVTPIHRTIRICSPSSSLPPKKVPLISIQGFHSAESAPLFFSRVYQHRAGHLIRRSHARGTNPPFAAIFCLSSRANSVLGRIVSKMPALWNPVKLAKPSKVNTWPTCDPPTAPIISHLVLMLVVLRFGIEQKKRRLEDMEPG